MKIVKIIIADTQLFTDDAEQILSKIAPHYAEKYNNTKIKEEAVQELVTGFLLAEYLGINQDEQLIYNQYGKPFLVSKDKFFNVSHSENCVVLAIAECNVGIDVEKITSCHEPTVNKVFSTKQKEELLRLECNAKNVAFTRMWTEWEAMLKLKGTGFDSDWNKEMDPEEFFNIYTILFYDFIITCATEEKVYIVTEKL